MLINNKIKRWSIFSAVMMSLLFIPVVQADIFKCTNAKGAIYYNDKPCSVKDKQKKMKAEKDVKGGFIPEKIPLTIIKEDIPKNDEVKTKENSIQENQKKVENKKKRPSGKRPSAEEERILFINTHAGSGSDSNETNYFKNKTD